MIKNYYGKYEARMNKEFAPQTTIVPPWRSIGTRRPNIATG